MSSSSSLPIVREARDHINHYTDALSQIISRDLSNTLLTKIQFQRYVNWLLRLDKSEKVDLSGIKWLEMVLNQCVIGKTGIPGYTHTDHQEENQAAGIWRRYYHLHQRACACCIYTDSKHLWMVPRFVQAEWNGVWIRDMGAWTNWSVRRHLQTTGIWTEPIELSSDCRLLQVDIGAMFSGNVP